MRIKKGIIAPNDRKISPPRTHKNIERGINAPRNRTPKRPSTKLSFNDSGRDMLVSKTSESDMWEGRPWLTPKVILRSYERRSKLFDPSPATNSTA
jgi:hypothetical protein